MRNNKCEKQFISLGEAIQFYREQNNMSIRKLSKITGVSPAYISRIERSEKRNPGVHVVKKLSLALNVNLYDYVEDNPNEELNSEQVETSGK